MCLHLAKKHLPCPRHLCNKFLSTPELPWGLARVVIEYHFCYWWGLNVSHYEDIFSFSNFLSVFIASMEIGSLSVPPTSPPYPLVKAYYKNFQAEISFKIFSFHFDT